MPLHSGLGESAVHESQLNRRSFVEGLAACGASALLPGVLDAESSRPQTVVPDAKITQVAEVFLDLHRVHKWNSSNGDTWDPFWADDDNLYTFNCDGRGFGAKAMNLAFNKLAGDVPSELVGSQVNSMEEYGNADQKGPDNATWKACGQECIDGVFYAFVSRNVYGSDSNDALTRQLALNSSLIKSTDRGRTWTRPAQLSYEKPMWPGARFGAPFFVHYGRNGSQVSRDGALDYVYACSTNGFWNDGDTLILGRVKRSRLADLNSKDWEYLRGEDGGIAGSWIHDIGQAKPILSCPAKCGQTPITFVPELKVYLLISWYNTARMTKWFEPNEMRYDFYQAPHPWGPWTQVGSCTDRFLGPEYHMYGPSICARFQRRREADVQVSLFTSGCPFDDCAGTPYKIWHIPLLLRTTALHEPVIVAAADTRTRYEGPWYPWTTSAEADVSRLPRATQTKGSSAELTFTGTGIEYIAEKSSSLGKVDIHLDGALQETTSLELDDFPAFLGVSIFSKHNLRKGQHKIRIVNAEDARINLEAFWIYS